MTKFYHSSAWGFDTSIIEKKEKAKRFLDEVGLPCCIECLCKHNEVKNFFDRRNIKYPLLLIVIDRETYKQIGSFDIMNFSQVQGLVKPNLSSFFCADRLTYCFIDQMFPCRRCFTATIISDGKGNGIIEFLTGIVDNRYLTSGGGNKLIPERIIFNDYKLVYCDDMIVLKTMWNSLKICLFYRGYYECSYATINNVNNVFFSYYSDDEAYQNICLDYYEYDSLKYRCAYIAMMENEGV